MSVFQAFFLGIIQGLCEFFPISSSAHLRLFKYFFYGTNQESYLLFELVCNLGTILAAIFFLRNQIIHIFKHEKKTLFFLALAILPLVPIYLFFKPIKETFQKIEYLGFFFLVTSAFLFLATKTKEKKERNSSLNRKIKDMLWIGLMQAMALIPGVSRSGTTIAGGCLRGWSVKEAITFSFILAIPTIIGGNMLEALKIYLKKEPTIDLDLGNYLIGFAASFLMGSLVIKYIFKIENKKKLLPFAWYCFTIGIITLIYFNLR